MYVLGPKRLRLNYIQISQLFVDRTNVSADFWTLGFCPQYGENCGATGNGNGNFLGFLKGQSFLKKTCKQHQNRPINRDTIHVHTMSPSKKQRTGLGA